VLRLLNKPIALKQFVNDRLGHDRRYALDSTKLRGLGWEPRIDFDQGMETTVRWYLENREWWSPLKSGEFWEFYRRNYRPVDSGAS
jgi:dTDP-glucose 4,6-dehydratase